MKNKKKRQGFTLIELIIVIAILGILAAIAIPKYNVSKNRAAVTAHLANVQMLRSAARMKILDKDEDFEWPNDDKNDAKNHLDYVEKWPKVPKGIDFEGTPYKLTYTKGDDKVKSTLTITPDEGAIAE